MIKMISPLRVSRFCGKRDLWSWLNTIFNQVDRSRIEAVGPDRAAAEWLIRCGAAVKWKAIGNWHTDYNTLPSGNLERYKIEEIDATESCVMHVGFPHLEGLKHLKRIKFHKCMYLNDESLAALNLVKDTLENLEITSCGNITDEGIKSLKDLKMLRYLLLFDLPEVKDREGCIKWIQQALPTCEIEFPLPSQK